jgi:cyclohexanone monooxygenase
MRRDLESAMNSLFELFLKGSLMQDGVREAVRSSMVEKLKNHELSDYLIPQFPFGCRRPTPGIDYLESLMDAKVQTVIGNISRISGEDVITEDGAVYPVDVLICATGFDTTYKPSFPIVGNSGQSLHDAWETNVQGYLGLAAPQFPNYFMILGPNSPVGNGPVLVAIEQQVSYIIQMLSKFQKENVRSFEVSLEATKSFNRWKDHYMQHTVWTKDCRSWYKAGSKSGPVLALWPGSTLHYLETIQIPRYEDWKWSHPRGTNPWSFLGNGSSSAEKRPGGDLAWYIRNHDDSPVDPCLKFVSKS